MPDSRHLIASFDSVHNEVVFSLIPSAPAVHGATRRPNTSQLHPTQNGIGDIMVWAGWGHGMSVGLCGPGTEHLGLLGVFLRISFLATRVARGMLLPCIAITAAHLLSSLVWCREAAFRLVGSVFKEPVSEQPDWGVSHPLHSNTTCWSQDKYM